MSEINLSELRIEVDTKSDYDGETMLIVRLFHKDVLISEDKVGLGIGNE